MHQYLKTSYFEIFGWNYHSFDMTHTPKCAVVAIFLLTPSESARQNGQVGTFNCFWCWKMARYPKLAYVSRGAWCNEKVPDFGIFQEKFDRRVFQLQQNLLRNIFSDLKSVKRFMKLYYQPENVVILLGNVESANSRGGFQLELFSFETIHLHLHTKSSPFFVSFLANFERKVHHF